MNSRKQRGVAAVEFAIVAPLLFVLLFGIIEFSVALFDQAMLTNASREGARQGIVFNLGNPLTIPQIEAIVDAYLTDPDNGSSRLISLGGASTHNTVVIPDGPDPGDRLTVTVNYTYTFLVLRPLVALLGGALPGTLDLSATTVMRME